MINTNLKTKTLPLLIKAVRQEIALGLEKSKGAVESLKAITFWKIGRLICSHLSLK